MNVIERANLAVRMPEIATLLTLIDRGERVLAAARNSAEILEATNIAGLAYDLAKKAARLAQAKGAHDSVIADAHRLQANALEMEARAKHRLADEYDAAQERGDIAAAGGDRKIKIPERNFETTGIPAKVVHEAREIRDAEEADPGIVSRTLQEAVEAGQEPTRAKVRRAVKTKSNRRNQPRQNHNSPSESQHDRDLRMLLGVWESACESAREEFIATVS